MCCRYSAVSQQVGQLPGTCRIRWRYHDNFWMNIFDALQTLVVLHFGDAKTHDQLRLHYLISIILRFPPFDDRNCRAFSWWRISAAAYWTRQFRHHSYERSLCSQQTQSQLAQRRLRVVANRTPHLVIIHSSHHHQSVIKNTECSIKSGHIVFQNNFGNKRYSMWVAANWLNWSSKGRRPTKSRIGLSILSLQRLCVVMKVFSHVFNASCSLSALSDNTFCAKMVAFWWQDICGYRWYFLGLDYNEPTST